MIKKLLVMAVLVLSVAAAHGARAEDVCVDAGTVGPVGLSVPSVCVPVP